MQASNIFYTLMFKKVKLILWVGGKKGLNGNGKIKIIFQESKAYIQTIIKFVHKRLETIQNFIVEILKYHVPWQERKHSTSVKPLKDGFVLSQNLKKMSFKQHSLCSGKCQCPSVGTLTRRLEVVSRLPWIALLPQILSLHAMVKSCCFESLDISI